MQLWHALAGVAALRLAELALAAANTRRLRAMGAVEHGSRHYPLLVALHACWLGALALAVPWQESPEPLAMVAFGGLLGARAWVIASLGRRWTTRVLALPGETLVRRGPYRFLRHPNYLVAAGEIALLPVAFGAWEVAVAFSFLNGMLLAHRVAVEERALSVRGTTAGAG